METKQKTPTNITTEMAGMWLKLLMELSIVPPELHIGQG